ncbi:unannotated protein [freshwater metagenome]|uniref:Unannotated protein n=1 Tax=freshwater metagenome TaxID=449393 RepID=A0A6J6W120_9ZZZZ|nr:nicotinamide riboside transporter PnuC [Actinomycetota bacterium]MSV63349.1 nicotinamide mononucleotide transporter [Actinomycetota bacterium]MSW26834.1 nicotinamide mononucleotide transporter [Actinomycetota bacterium]MSW33702.1 nicotinamide mononucleotide transporter [Actinomycetota bacterium]MSX31241.1 nicotinamide mononucleotide transporter [Actinomycetota bacterium]
MFILFRIWGYDLTALELVAALTSFIGVAYGITGKRITWPWWIISSFLYAVFFYKVNLLASATLQFVFIAAAVWGWFGWAPTGAVPGKLSRKSISYWAVGLFLSWIILAPALHRIGAAATWSDSFIFIGSFIAQVLMVYEKFENWPLWFIVDAVATIEYFTLGYWFTGALYLAFTFMALIGWRSWLVRVNKV